MNLPTRPSRRGPGRPAGSLGEVAQALLAAALVEPGTARELARRACVGDRVGMYTASRLLDGGQLVRVAGTRPAVLAAPACAAVCLLPEAVPVLPLDEADNPALAILGRLVPVGGCADPALA